MMISFVIGLMIGSAFGVCLMGALWAREREERLEAPVPVTTLPRQSSSRRAGSRPSVDQEIDPRLRLGSAS
jgi:hypothetical protein